LVAVQPNQIRGAGRAQPAARLPHGRRRRRADRQRLGATGTTTELRIAPVGRTGTHGGHLAAGRSPFDHRHRNRLPQAAAPGRWGRRWCHGPYLPSRRPGMRR